MEEAFNTLKEAFITAPILVYYNPDLPLVLETDLSDFALGEVVLQKQKDGKLHPITFHLRKLIPVEINYEIYNKELLAIVDYFQRWR